MWPITIKLASKNIIPANALFALNAALSNDSYFTA